MADDKTCGHKMCNCPVEDGLSFCTDHCREASEHDVAEIKCDCGHDGC